jgi:F5/8 type C domain
VNGMNAKATFAGTWLVALVACGGGDGAPEDAGAGPDGAGLGDAGPVTADAASDAGAGADGTSPDANACAGDTTIHVAPNGTGTACACASPCALEAGRDLARSRIAGAAADVVVELADGVYRLASTFTLGAADSGANGHAIVYRAAAGASPVVSGAHVVTGFSAVTGAPAVFSAPVAAGTKSRQLYVNGRRATRARGAAAPAGYTKTAKGFALGDPAIAGWPDRTKLEAVGTTAWKSFRCPVASADVAGGLALADPCWTASQQQAGVTFDAVAWLENARELVDEPGEFFLDEDGATLFYAPRAGEDVTKALVEVPVLESLVTGDGVHDVAFEGIGFAHATWLGPSGPDGYASLQASFTTRGGVLTKALANVTMHAASNVRFTRCRFAHLGGAALAFEVGAHDNVVELSRFEDISAAAVMIGDVTHEDDHHPKDPALIVHDNTVRGSYVTRAGAEYWDAPGLFVGYTTHTTLSGNELFDLPYTGISVGWGWGSVDVGGSGGYTTPSTSQANVVEKNLISHHMRVLRDGGGIYVLGAQAGAAMRGNVIANQGNAYGELYLDNGTQGYSVTGNVSLSNAKDDTPSPDPDRAYWMYLQVFAPVAKNNVVSGNFASDATLYTPSPIDPSNQVTNAAALSSDPASVAAILAAAGTPLRSPEIAQGMPATASSIYDTGHTAAAGNDGNAFDGWSAAAGDTKAYWQVDLGADKNVDAVEVVMRWALDQPETRRSFRVLAASDPTFATAIVLGAVDGTGLPHRAIYAADVTPPAKARYVRVEKTAPEYFYLAEVRVHGTP